jgi:integrase
MRKPYYLKSRRGWYLKINKGNSQIFLSEDKGEAWKIWKEQHCVENPETAEVVFAVVAEHYLLHALKAVDEKHYKRTSGYLADFCNDCGAVQVRRLKRFHVNRWLQKHEDWGGWAQYAAISAIKRALSWAETEGLIDNNPLAKMPLPSGGRREVLITDEQHSQLMTRQPLSRKGKPRKLAPAEAAFRQVLIALRLSGSRPGTIAKVARENVTADVSAWVMRRHKTSKKTKKPLTVYLSPCLQTLTRILLSRERSGPLFVNARGKPWTTSALVQRMARLRKWLNLPAGTVCYSQRHTYITNALKGGENPATVAELVGHVDLRMLAANYAHLDKEKEHLQQAALRITKGKMA